MKCLTASIWRAKGRGNYYSSRKNHDKKVALLPPCRMQGTSYGGGEDTAKSKTEPQDQETKSAREKGEVFQHGRSRQILLPGLCTRLGGNL